VHDKFKWNLNITVTNANRVEEAKLLNYLTTPNVLLWSAARASSAIPYLYDPVRLMQKTEEGEIVPYHRTETLYIDGSIGGDLPMQRMSELFNVNSFFVSQVNPHAIPFLAVDGGGILESKMRRRFLRTLKQFVGNELYHIVNQLITLGVLPSAL